jgi:hypothetical protein
VGPRAGLDVLQKKSLVSAGVGTPGPQVVTSRYTDFAITAPVRGSSGYVRFVSHCDKCQAYSLPVCDAVYKVARLVKALFYKPEGRGFDSRWCHWNFSLTYSFQPHYGPGIDSAYNRNEYQEYFLGG